MCRWQHFTSQLLSGTSFFCGGNLMYFCLICDWSWLLPRHCVTRLVRGCFEFSGGWCRRPELQYPGRRLGHRKLANRQKAHLCPVRVLWHVNYVNEIPQWFHASDLGHKKGNRICFLTTRMGKLRSSRLPGRWLAVSTVTDHPIEMFTALLCE